MAALTWVGAIVESVFGPARFGVIYLASGVAAEVLSQPAAASVQVPDMPSWNAAVRRQGLELVSHAVVHAIRLIGCSSAVPLALRQGFACWSLEKYVVCTIDAPLEALGGRHGLQCVGS